MRKTKVNREKSHLVKGIPQEYQVFDEETPIEQLEKIGVYWAAKQKQEAALEKLRKNKIEEGILTEKEPAIRDLKRILSDVWGKVLAFPDNLAPNLHGKSKNEIRERMVKELDKISKDIVEYLGK